MELTSTATTIRPTTLRPWWLGSRCALPSGDLRVSRRALRLPGVADHRLLLSRRWWLLSGGADVLHGAWRRRRGVVLRLLQPLHASQLAILALLKILPCIRQMVRLRSRRIVWVPCAHVSDVPLRTMDYCR